jgi:hypothetical protein
VPYEDQYTFLILSLSGSFSFENHAVYEIMRKNTVEPERPQMTVWRMPIGRWILKATNALRICNSCCFTATVVTRTPQCCVMRSLPIFFHYWTDQMKDDGMALGS